MSKELAIKLRDTLVSSWVYGTEGPSRRAHVLASNADGDLALFFTARRIVVLLVPLEPVPDWDTISTIEYRIRSLLAPAEGLFLAGARNVIHLVFLGGDARVRSWIQQVEFRSGSLKRAVAFHHVSVEGDELEVWDASVPLPWLDTTLKRIPDFTRRDAAPLSRQQLEALLSEARVVVLENRAWGKVMRRPAIATKVIMAVVVAVFVLQFYWSRGHPDGMAILWMMGACSGDLVAEGEIWRLLASAFLHGGYLHLVLNLSVLFQLGPFLERVLGTRRFVVLYGLSALGGSFAVQLAQPSGAAVGASTALCGLIAAMAVMAWRNSELFASNMVSTLRRDLLITLVLIAAISLVPGISLAGHLGGALAGAALTGTGLLVHGVPTVRRRRTDPTTGYRAAAYDGHAPPNTHLAHRPGRNEVGSAWSLLVTVSAAMVGLAMTGSLIAGFVSTKPWELRHPPTLKRVPVAHLPLSLEIPSRLAAKVAVRLDLPETATLGRLGSDPLFINVGVEPLRAFVRSDDIPALVDQYARSLELENLTKGRTQDGWPLTTGIRKSGEALVATVSFVANDEYLVMVSVLRFTGLPDAWVDIADTIPTTVRIERQRPVRLQDVPADATWEQLESVAVAAYANGSREVAEIVLERMTARHPDDSAVWLMLGKTYSAAQRFEEAAGAFTTASKLDPGLPDAYQGLGDALARLDRLPEAAEALRRRVELEPSNPSALTSLARVLIKSNAFESAIQYLEKARELDSNDTVATYLLGDALLGDGRNDEAIALFRQTLERADHPSLKNDIAYALAERRVALDWAQELAQESIEETRTDLEAVTTETITWPDILLTSALGHVWDTLATIYLRQGNLDQAGPYLQAAWSVSRIGEVALHLGELWEQKGDQDLAATWYARAATFPAEARAGRDNLARLLGDDAAVERALAGVSVERWPILVGPFFPSSGVDTSRSSNAEDSTSGRDAETDNVADGTSGGTPGSPAAPPPASRETPVYVLVSPAASRPIRMPPGDATGFVVLPPSVSGVRRSGTGKVSDRVKTALEALPPPVVFPTLEPVHLVMPARVLCDSSPVECRVLYLSPEDTPPGWGMSGDAIRSSTATHTLPTDAR